MIARLHRFRPNRAAFAALTGLAWAVSVGVLRDFVWADLKEGMLDLRSLPRVMRALVILGFVLLAAMIVALLFNDLWRAQFDLISLAELSAGRGAFIPWAVIPATMFLMTVTWTFVLNGGMHSHILLRLSVIGLYSVNAMSWLFFAASTQITPWFFAAFAALGATILFYFLRGPRQPRPGLEFGMGLVLVGAVFASAQASLVTGAQISGVPLGLQIMSFNVMTLSSLVLPMLLYIGIDIANFTRQAATWAVAIVHARLPAAAAYAALLLALGLRLRTVVAEAFDSGQAQSAREALNGYAGGLGVVLVMLAAGAGILWLAGRHAADGAPAGGVEEVDAHGTGEANQAGETAGAGEEIAAEAERIGFAGILLYMAPTLLAFFILTVAPLGAVADALLGLADAMGAGGIASAMTAISGVLANQVLEPWHLVLEVLAVAAAVHLARRAHLTAGEKLSGQAALALYLGLFGARRLWYALTDRGRPLEMFYWEGPRPVDFWLVLILAVTALVWLARRRLTSERAANLLFLTLVTGLLRQTDFIENPFSSVFAFAGVGLIAFGLFWEALTGGSWANGSSRGLPRPARIYLYLGYILLTATVVNWALASHDLGAINNFTGGVGVTGLDQFGRPILYALFPLLLFRREKSA